MARNEFPADTFARVYILLHLLAVPAPWSYNLILPWKFCVQKFAIFQTKIPATIENAANGDNYFKWKCVWVYYMKFTHKRNIHEIFRCCSTWPFRCIGLWGYGIYSLLLLILFGIEDKEFNLHFNTHQLLLDLKRGRYEIIERANTDEEWKTTIELRIKGLHKDDLGEFTCSATSSMGSSEATLRVYGNLFWIPF